MRPEAEGATVPTAPSQAHWGKTLSLRALAAPVVQDTVEVTLLVRQGLPEMAQGERVWQFA